MLQHGGMTDISTPWSGSPIPTSSRAFYEALGFEFRREMDIVRNGEKEATNYFFGVPGQDAVLELTLNHDGRTYDIGTGYGHIALAVDDLDGDARAAEGAGHRAGARAVSRPRGRLAPVLRARSGRLPDRADRPQRPLTSDGAEEARAVLRMLQELIDARDLDGLLELFAEGSGRWLLRQFPGSIPFVG